MFKIDIETCHHCGGAVKIIACLEDPLVIEKILVYLNNRDHPELPARRRPRERAPPGQLA